MSLNRLNSNEVEEKMEDLKYFKTIFIYAATCEYNFERNAAAISGYKRLTTFTADLSIAEWTGGKKDVIDTLKRCAKEWCNNHKYFAELVGVAQMKSWEHNARHNHKWSEFYADAYYYLKVLYFEHNKGNDEAIRYYFDNID